MNISVKFVNISEIGHKFTGYINEKSPMKLTGL